MLPKTLPADWVTLPEAARFGRVAKQWVRGELDLITLPAAACLADVTERWMRSLVQGGRVVGVKVGRNYAVSRASAAAYVRSKTEGRPRATKPKRATRRKR
jgi:hypothetical protein